MATFPFNSGLYPASPYGEQDKFRFAGTWAVGDTWTIPVIATLSGNFTLGKGNIAGQTFSCVGKLKERLFIGFGSSFAASGVNDPTGWEEQSIGSAVVAFLSQYGFQDSVQAFGVFEGKLVVIGRYSIQIWQVDANPANFALLQTLDNSGTRAMLSVKSIGDLDVFYLEDSGVRSVRTKEQTSNSYISDVGTAIDLAIRDDIASAGVSGVCAIVEPTTKQYWLYINSKIYVLSFYPESKIVAWSTYKPQYQSEVTRATGPTYVFPGTVGYAGISVGVAYYWVKGTGEGTLTSGSISLTSSGGFVADTASCTVTGPEGNAVTGVLYRVDNAFTPEKMVVYNGQIYIRGSDKKIYRYGGSDNNTFDYCRAVAELPWLDMKEPSIQKQLLAIDAAFKGHWQIQTSTNPRASSYVTAIDRGSQTSPNMVDDSTFDVGRFAASGNGTHLKVKATSYTPSAAKLGKLNIIYKNSGEK